MTFGAAIVGCGKHALHHVENFGGAFKLIGVYDPDPEAARNARARHGAPAFSSYEELLKHHMVDTVFVCSPDEFHLSQMKLALLHDKNVFCEKPLLDQMSGMKELYEIFDIAEKKSLAFTSCHPRRFDDPAIWYKAQEANGSLDQLGKVLSFTFDFSYHMPTNEWKSSRSLLLDHLNHEVDLMNFFFGIRSFSAWKLCDSFDHYEVVGRRDDGISFHFTGTRRLESQTYPEWCRIRFEKGEVILDMMAQEAIIANHNEKTRRVTSGVGIDYTKRLSRTNAHFADTIRYNLGRRCSFDSGFRAFWNHRPYLSRQEMLMNTEASLVLQNDGIQRITVRD